LTMTSRDFEDSHAELLFEHPRPIISVIVEAGLAASAALDNERGFSDISFFISAGINATRRSPFAPL